MSLKREIARGALAWFFIALLSMEPFGVGRATGGEAPVVKFELTSDALLTIWLSREPGGKCGWGDMIRAPLIGEFVARLSQSDRSVALAIEAFEFSSVPEATYTIRGRGSYGESSPRMWIAVPQNFASLDLVVDINEWAGIHMYSEFAGTAAWFPRIRMTANQWPVWAQPDRCFHIVLAARPSEEDAPRFFRRGDLDGDRNRSILDAMLLLRYLFLGEAESFSCEDSGDVNDDGALDLADVVHLLGHLFLGRAPPAPPLAFCGLDLTDDELGCGGQIGCLADTG